MKSNEVSWRRKLLQTLLFGIVGMKNFTKYVMLELKTAAMTYRGKTRQGHQSLWFLWFHMRVWIQVHRGWSWITFFYSMNRIISSHRFPGICRIHSFSLKPLAPTNPIFSDNPLISPAQISPMVDSTQWFHVFRSRHLETLQRDRKWCRTITHPFECAKW